MWNRKSRRFAEKGEKTKISCKQSVLNFATYNRVGKGACSFLILRLREKEAGLEDLSGSFWPEQSNLIFQRDPMSSHCSLRQSRAIRTFCCRWMIFFSVVSSHECFFGPKIFHTLKKKCYMKGKQPPTLGNVMRKLAHFQLTAFYGLWISKHRVKWKSTSMSFAGERFLSVSKSEPAQFILQKGKYEHVHLWTQFWCRPAVVQLTSLGLWFICAFTYQLFNKHLHYAGLTERS